ncbi:unnamed protein product [Arctogadus glacialis]
MLFTARRSSGSRVRPPSISGQPVSAPSTPTPASGPPLYGAPLPHSLTLHSFSLHQYCCPSADTHPHQQGGGPDRRKPLLRPPAAYSQ